MPDDDPPRYGADLTSPVLDEDRLVHGRVHAVDSLLLTTGVWLADRREFVGVRTGPVGPYLVAEQLRGSTPAARATPLDVPGWAREVDGLDDVRGYQRLVGGRDRAGPGHDELVARLRQLDAERVAVLPEPLRRWTGDPRRMPRPEHPQFAADGSLLTPSGLDVPAPARWRVVVRLVGGALLLAAGIALAVALRRLLGFGGEDPADDATVLGVVPGLVLLLAGAVVTRLGTGPHDHGAEDDVRRCGFATLDEYTAWAVAWRRENPVAQRYSRGADGAAP